MRDLESQCLGSFIFYYLGNVVISNIHDQLSRALKATLKISSHGDGHDQMIVVSIVAVKWVLWYIRVPYLLGVLRGGSSKCWIDKENAIFLLQLTLLFLLDCLDPRLDVQNASDFPRIGDLRLACLSPKYYRHST